MDHPVAAVVPDDLPRVVDAIGLGVGAAWEIDCRVGTAIIEEAVDAAADLVVADYLS